MKNGYGKVIVIAIVLTVLAIIGAIFMNTKHKETNNVNAIEIHRTDNNTNNVFQYEDEEEIIDITSVHTTEEMEQNHEQYIASIKEYSTINDFEWSIITNADTDSDEFNSYDFITNLIDNTDELKVFDNNRDNTFKSDNILDCANIEYNGYSVDYVINYTSGEIYIYIYTN